MKNTHTKVQIREMISRHERWLDKEKGGKKLRKSKVRWVGFDFSKRRLDGAAIYDSCLQDCRFINTSMRGVSFAGSDLRDSLIWRCDAVDSRFSDANMDGASVKAVDMSGAIFMNVNATHASIVSCILKDAIANRTNFTGACMDYSDLSDADFEDAIFTHASMSDCKVSDGTDLASVEMTRVRGVSVASAHWSDHGETGRALLGVLVDGQPRFFCGCFSGSYKELNHYIKTDARHLTSSRTKAARFVYARLREMAKADGKSFRR